MRKQTTSVREELFAELTYHAAYDPQRAIRTDRHKLIRHFGDRLEPVLPNVDDSPSKSLLIAAGWGTQRRPRLELYDLIMDPGEMRNLAEVPDFARVSAISWTTAARLDGQTADPLLDGPVPVPAGRSSTIPLASRRPSRSSKRSTSAAWPSWLPPRAPSH